MTGWTERGTGVHFEDAARLVAMVPMKPSEAHILWLLIAELDSVEWRKPKRKRLAEASALDPTTISKAMAGLRDRGIIAKRRGGDWRLTAFLCWKGTEASYAEEIEDRRAEVEEATGWHTSRAIANLDSESETITVDAEQDAPRAGMKVVERPEMSDLRLAPRSKCGDRPDCIGEDDWLRLRARFPGAASEPWTAIRRCIEARTIEEDIHDWADDFAFTWWETPERVKAAAEKGVIVFWRDDPGEPIDF